MKYFVKNFVHCLSPWQDTSKLPFVLLLILTAGENSVICENACGVMALLHPRQSGWLGEQWYWLGGKMCLCFHSCKPKWRSVKLLMKKKKKRKQRKIAGGMKHNAKSKTSVFLGSASLGSIIHLWQNPCRSWGGEKTRKYILYVSVFAPFSVVPLHRHGNRQYIYVLHRSAPSKINANL